MEKDAQRWQINNSKTQTLPRRKPTIKESHTTSSQNKNMTQY